MLNLKIIATGTVVCEITVLKRSSTKLDSALSRTSLSLTQRYPGHHSAWLSAILDITQLESVSSFDGVLQGQAGSRKNGNAHTCLTLFGQIGTGSRELAFRGTGTVLLVPLIPMSCLYICTSRQAGLPVFSVSIILPVPVYSICWCFRRYSTSFTPVSDSCCCTSRSSCLYTVVYLQY